MVVMEKSNVPLVGQYLYWPDREHSEWPGEHEWFQWQLSLERGIGHVLMSWDDSDARVG
jgi:hypothetical protein